MGRPTKRQVFVRALIKDIETEPGWVDYREAIYKEYILHLKNGTPRWLYEHIKEEAGMYWDYQINEVDPTLTKEELLCDMKEILDDELTRKLIKDYTGKTAI